MVTAKDGAQDPRIGTASVTVMVNDVEDEIPIFHRTVYEARVPENAPDYLVSQVNVCIFPLCFFFFVILTRNVLSFMKYELIFPMRCRPTTQIR